MSKFKSKAVSSETTSQDHVSSFSSDEVVRYDSPQLQSIDSEDESRVHSEETTVSSTLSTEDEDNSHETSLEAGSFHDPLDTRNTEIEGEVCTSPEMETPSVSTLTEEDFNTEFSESDEHIVCLQNAKFRLLDGNEPDPVLRAISRFYRHPDSHRKALGTLLHAAWATKRIVFGMSRPLLAKLLKLDPNVPSITADEINSSLYRRVRKACHDSGFISIIKDSEAGQRGKGKIAIAQVRFRPVQAYVCDVSRKSLARLCDFQTAQVESYRDGKHVPTWELNADSNWQYQVHEAFFNLVSMHEGILDELESLVEDLQGLRVTDEFVSCAQNALSSCEQSRATNWAIQELLSQFREFGVSKRQLSLPPVQSIRSRCALSTEQFNRLICDLEEALINGLMARAQSIILDALKLGTLTHMQRVHLCAGLDLVSSSDLRDRTLKMIVTNDQEGYPVPRPVRKR